MFGSIVFILFLLLIIIGLVALSLRIVAQSHAYVIERLGVYKRTWERGPHFKIPFIDTDMTGVLSEDMKETIQKTIPVGRFGTPEDIANAVAFLAGSGSAYITGQVLQVDGGMVM